MEAKAKTECCETCYFWKRLTGLGIEALCVRFPASVWKRPDAWCAEYEPAAGQGGERLLESTWPVRLGEHTISGRDSEMATATTADLREFVRSAGGRVDFAGHRINGARILGKVSRNGRTYSDKAVKEAAGLYRGQSVFLDHATAGERLVETAANN